MKVEIKSLAQANVIAAGGEADQAPMIWSGGMAWIADFPDPSNFYGPILGCGGAVPGGWNWSWYCNEELDAEASKADALADPSQADTRIDMWRDIFTKVMADAPWVPVFNEQRYTIRSPRLVADDAAAEEARLNEAITRLRRSVDQLLDSGRVPIGTPSREVLETYRMFAHDRGWLNQLGEAIRAGLTAEAAVDGSATNTGRA